MKARFFVIGLFLFALVACTEKTQVPEPVEGPSIIKTPSPELSAIDSLMWHQPDSALMRLLPWFAPCRDAFNAFPDNAMDTIRRIQCVTTTTEYNRHYAHLLLAELLYKNDSAQTNRSELSQAVYYFDSLVLADTRRVSLRGLNRRNASHTSATTPQSIAFLDARAHYINGVGYYEQVEMVSSCKEYMKALEIMEDRFEEKELIGHKARFVALTYTRLSSLFSDMYLHEQAIYFAQLSLASNQNLDVPRWHIARMLCEIGIQYNMLEQLDSAEYYYKNATNVLNDTNHLLYRDISTRQIYLLYKKKGLEKNTLSQLHYFLNQANSKTEYLSRCLTIGDVFYHEKQLDSAWYYLNKVYNNTNSIASKKQAAEWLVEICKIQRRNSEALEYASFLVPFANQEENNSGIKSQLNQLYNTFVQAKSNKQHQMEVMEHAKQIIIVTGSLLFVLLIIIILNVKNKRHKRKLETQIETERYSHKMQQAALAGRLRQSNAALKAQSKTALPITPLSCMQDQNEAENYTEEPICQQILAVCNDNNNSIKSTVPVSAYASIALTDAQKAQLKEAAVRHYGPLFEKLKQRHPELKEKDFLYCYLCLLGLDNMQIAVLTQLSYRTIWEREKRLQTLFHADNRIAVILHEMMMH